MIRFLAALLLLTYSLFGWASAYPDQYEGVPKTFKDGDTIKAEDFNNNNESIKEAINNRIISNLLGSHEVHNNPQRDSKQDDCPQGHKRNGD